MDPRDYLGFGFFDFVPTKLILTSELKTASDDWFSDFANSGLPEIATGRLPVRTVDEANTVVEKIVGYERDRDRGDWTDQALLVADRNDDSNFSQESQSVQALLPKAMTVTDVFATDLDAKTAGQEVLAGINSGKLLVNYIGHGSVEIWSGDDLLDDTKASSLSNGTRLPLISWGFRAPHQCTSLFCHTPVQLGQRSWRSIRQRAGKFLGFGSLLSGFP